MSSKKDLVRELFELLNLAETGRAAMDAIYQSLFRLLDGIEMTEEEKVSFTEIKAEAFNNFLEAALSVYEESFTENEICDLIVFYQSPVGNKLIKEGPSMMGKIVTMAAASGRDLDFKLREKLQDKMLD